METERGKLIARLGAPVLLNLTTIVYSNDFPWYSDPLPGTQVRNVESSLQNWNVRDFVLLCRFPPYTAACHLLISPTRGVPEGLDRGSQNSKKRHLKPSADARCPFFFPSSAI